MRRLRYWNSTRKSEWVSCSLARRRRIYFPVRLWAANGVRQVGLGVILTLSRPIPQTWDDSDRRMYVRGELIMELNVDTLVMFLEIKFLVVLHVSLTLLYAYEPVYLCRPLKHTQLATSSACRQSVRISLSCIGY
jgi:hypothetical protein